MGFIRIVEFRGDPGEFKVGEIQHVRKGLKNVSFCKLVELSFEWGGWVLKIPLFFPLFAHYSLLSIEWPGWVDGVNVLIYRGDIFQSLPGEIGYEGGSQRQGATRSIGSTEPKKTSQMIVKWKIAITRQSLALTFSSGRIRMRWMKKDQLMGTITSSPAVKGATKIEGLLQAGTM